ncbi:unnamed protein product, partial [marine sediment metagenome]
MSKNVMKESVELLKILIMGTYVPIVIVKVDEPVLKSSKIIFGG